MFWLFIGFLNLLLWDYRPIRLKSVTCIDYLILDEISEACIATLLVFVTLFYGFIDIGPLLD